MVDRIDKLDPKLFRVQETPQDRERRQHEEQEEEEREQEKDEFDKGRPAWKKLIAEPPMKSPAAGRPAWKMVDPVHSEEIEGEVATEAKEESLTLSRRVLVLWGILDLEGKPRIPVIVTYLVVGAVIAVSSFLILGILWR
jgi:hypothetical protein